MDGLKFSGKAAGLKGTRSGGIGAPNSLLRSLGPRLLPLPGVSFQLFSPGLVALLGLARFLVHMMVMAPGVSRESGSK